MYGIIGTMKGLVAFLGLVGLYKKMLVLDIVPIVSIYGSIKNKSIEPKNLGICNRVSVQLAIDSVR